MNFLKCIKPLVQSTDLFYSTDMLRYNSKSKYKTVTGGIVSLIMIVAIIIGFSSMIISTMEKTAIYSTFEVKKFSDPSLMESIAGKDNFMIGAYVQSYLLEETFDLINGPQMFEVKLIQITKDNQTYNNNQIKLVRCTREHWFVDEEIQRKFQSLLVDKWLCPELGQKFSFLGTIDSFQASFYQYSVSICRNTTQNQNKCLPQEIIDEKMAEYTNFLFTHSFLNPIINPNQRNHIQYSLNTENFVVFSKTVGAEAWIYFQEYKVFTDDSILPFEQMISEQGLVSQDKFFKSSIAVSQKSDLSNVFIGRSKTNLTYRREFRKLSAVISYIGGLVGAMIIVLFMVKSYTDSALEINISLDLFEVNRENDQDRDKEKDKEENREEGHAKGDVSFNIVNFISMNIYRLVKRFSIGERFKVAKSLVKYEQEIQKHLDIKLLLKRIIKLEYCINHILSQADIKTVKSKFVSYEGAKYHRNLLNKDEKDKYSNEQRQEYREQDRLSFNRRASAIQGNNAGEFPLNSQEVILKNSEQDYHGLQIILNGYLKDSLPSSQNNSKF